MHAHYGMSARNGSPVLARGAVKAARGPRRSVVAKAQTGAIQEKIVEVGGSPVAKEQFVGSSGWSSQYIYECEDGAKYFVKTAMGHDADTMFRGEADGLMAMHATGTMAIPEVFYYGNFPGKGGALRGTGSFIIMEYLKFGGRADQAALGRALAEMHLAEPKAAEAKAGKFGFDVDNTIGGTPQPNGWMDDWVAFFAERRLRHQLRLANDSTLNKMGNKLADNLDKFFEGVEVKPSVLHGDLWSGNIASVDGKPSIFDPAVYYGHSEAEFGMSWCAGFGQPFWDAYFSVIPKAPGFAERKEIYTLYHYLNHYNLFGSGYYGQCESILRRLNAKL